MESKENELKSLYMKSLIEEGAKSEKFKLLPKNATDLNIGEVCFLMDYINKMQLNKLTNGL
jgi:hypothetical protein